ncbi:MAG TPA: Rrf2 family transcriptional regulator [Candidatus Saccharimonadales bacterium]|nr:Rrf2 family transcriptional regulator [Candidatus Saccharimonadales bacterium]
MQITRATDYAVRVMVHLASAPHGQKYPLNELAVATGVQESFLSKILQRLVHQGMLLSQRGSGGGFVLNRAPDQVTLLDVIEAIEGPTQLNHCIGEDGHCSRKEWCGVSPTWDRAQLALTQVLSGVSIAQLAEETLRLLAIQANSKSEASKSATVS